MASPKFIIIDDDPVSNMICKLTIEKVVSKADIKVFVNAENALKYITTAYTALTKEPTILLLDINMPVMTGWEFLEAFENLSDHAKSSIGIYILSSSLDSRDRDRSFSEKRVKDHFIKPLTADVINSMIEAQ